MDRGGIEGGDLTFSFFSIREEAGRSRVYMLLLDHDANKDSPLGMDSLDYRERGIEKAKRQ